MVHVDEIRAATLNIWMIFFNINVMVIINANLAQIQVKLNKNSNEKKSINRACLGAHFCIPHGSPKPPTWPRDKKFCI